ncbi:MAG TPA: cyclic pyranopterin monophosphate synthase MoaC [Candidatus Dormibacteraeota bacterium]|nr:cyclic pyranopterin monophosphate synthase MoaC [Candidatus Dormibacteraeota bacterium]
MNPNSTPKLSHLDPHGRARMVDVGDRPSTDREATAEGAVRLNDLAWAAISDGTVTKGDVLEVARLAGIMSAKRTPELIPLCHPLTLTHVAVNAWLTTDPRRVQLRATVRCHGNTGVEMEALTAVSVAALTVIDMVKSLDHWAEIGPISLLSKRGGRSGEVHRPDPGAEAPGEG